MFSKNLTTVSGNITPYVAAAIYYLIVTIPLIKVVGIVERRMADSERGGGPRPKAAAPADEEAQPAKESADAAQGTASACAPAKSDDRGSLVDALSSPFRSHPTQEA